MPTTKMATGHVRKDRDGPKSINQVQIGVRLPKPVFNELQRIAVEEGHSISSKIRDFVTAAVKAQAKK